jgi:hypothetical protein
MRLEVTAKAPQVERRRRLVGPCVSNYAGAGEVRARVPGEHSGKKDRSCQTFNERKPLEEPRRLPMFVQVLKDMEQTVELKYIDK